VSLGSVGYSAAGETTRTILAAVKSVGCRALIYSGPESRLADMDTDHVKFIGFVPYEDLLCEVSAMVHHGGAGTTAFASRSGRPSVLIPHFADHFYWSHALAERDAAPPPLPRHSLTTERLARAIDQVLGGSRYRDGAKRISEKMRNEEGAQRAAECVSTWARRPTRRWS
jgi:UDP:flavonoid glycosyltransferase YjiC (YdhE family)